VKRLLPLPLVLLCAAPLVAQDPLCCAHANTPWRDATAAPTRGYDVKYLRLEWDLDPAEHAIAGRVTLWFNVIDAPLGTILLDASDALVIEQVDHQGVPAAFDHLPNDRLAVHLPAPLPPGALDSITVTYHGVPDPTGFGSFVTSHTASGPVLWTLSEPYGAKDWWPCKQDLHDKADSLDMRVTTPNIHRAAGIGLLVDSTTVDGRTTWHWRHRHPIAYYLIAVAVADYAVFETTIDLPEGPLPMVTYFYGTDTAGALASAQYATEQMALFRDLFGPYPFMGEKYGHARFGWGGGMEHQTMSFMGHWGYELTAHELAHQWFGNKVTCASWADLWLNEGFATYLTGLCDEHLRPERWADWKAARVSHITTRPDGSLYCADTLNDARLFDGRLTYDKGAMVLHMLRWVVGDDAFFTACRSYLNDPALAYGSARTSDLQAHMETASGMDLSTFFDQWYQGEGHPTYTATWTQHTDGTVRLRLDQTTSHPSVSHFVLPVPVLFRGNGADSTVVLHHTHSGELFTFHLPFQAEMAFIDPEIWLISGNNRPLHVPVARFDDEGALVYPNPATDHVRIFLQGMLHGTVQVEMIDAIGRPVRTWNTTVVDDTITLPLVGMAAGTYIMQLRAGDLLLRLRMIKE